MIGNRYYWFVRWVSNGGVVQWSDDSSWAATSAGAATAG